MNTAIDDFPPSVAQIHVQAFASLAAILLDTAKNRVQIEAEISQDEVLMQVLSDYETVIVEAVSPPFECRRGVPVPLDQHCVEVIAKRRMDRRGPTLMPDILGVWTNPADGLPWYQASPVEFVPSSAHMRTSNIGGPPVLWFAITDSVEACDFRLPSSERRLR